MKNFDFDFPVSRSAKFAGMLNVECWYSQGEVNIAKVLYAPYQNEIPKNDVTPLLDTWCDYLMEQLQEAAEHHAYELGLKVHRLDDPRETELSEILKP